MPSITTTHVAFVDRSSQEPDVLYVMPDETTWFTPDGVGRIYLFNDAEQTDPMTEAQAIGEVDPDRIVHVEHACDYEVCDMVDGRTHCGG